MKIKSQIVALLITAVISGCQKDGDKGAASRLIEGAEMQDASSTLTTAAPVPTADCRVQLSLDRGYPGEYGGNRLIFKFRAYNNGTIKLIQPSTLSINQPDSFPPDGVHQVKQTGSAALIREGLWSIPLMIAYHNSAKTKVLGQYFQVRFYLAETRQMRGLTWNYGVPGSYERPFVEESFVCGPPQL